MNLGNSECYENVTPKLPKRAALHRRSLFVLGVRARIFLCDNGEGYIIIGSMQTLTLVQEPDRSGLTRDIENLDAKAAFEFLCDSIR